MWHWELSPCFLPGGNGDHAQEKWLTIFLPFVSGPAHITLSPSSLFLFSRLYVRTAPRLHFLTSLLLFSSYFDILCHLLQLIDSFASEIGVLKEEMVQTLPTADKELMDSQGWDVPSSLEVTLRLLDIPVQVVVSVILLYLFLFIAMPLG